MNRKRNWLDVQSPILKPLWLRMVIVGVCTIWAIFELVGGNLFWAILFGAAAAYLGYQLLVVFSPDDGEGANK